MTTETKSEETKAEATQELKAAAFKAAIAASDGKDVASIEAFAAKILASDPGDGCLIRGIDMAIAAHSHFMPSTERLFADGADIAPFMDDGPRLDAFEQSVTLTKFSTRSITDIARIAAAYLKFTTGEIVEPGKIEIRFVVPPSQLAS
jgi:hypothetical protein